MNFFRVPLNALVVIVLYKVGELNNATVFTICSLWLLVALLLQHQLKGMAAPAHSTKATTVEQGNL